MRIPRTEEVAILFMSELVTGYPEKFITLASVAKRHGVSLLFLKKLARLLKFAELVQSKEGVSGGYMLTKDPKGMSLWDIMKAVDHRTFEHTQFHKVCPLNIQCIPQRIHRSMNEALEEKFSDITLVDILTKKTL